MTTTPQPSAPAATVPATPVQVLPFVNEALAHVGHILFRPFIFSKWALFAIPATLTLVGEGGFSFSFNFFDSSGGGSPTSADVERFFRKALDFLTSHLLIVILIAVAVTLVAFALYVFYRWLNARGQFMLLDAVTTDHLTLSQSWSRHAVIANSLMWFRINWDLTIFNLFLPLTFFCLAFFAIDVKPWLLGTGAYEFTGWSLFGLLYLIASVLVLLPLIWFFGSVYRYLAIPIMFTSGQKAWPAYKHALTHIAFPYFPKVLGFFALMIVGNIAAGFLQSVTFIILIIVTCCCISFIAAIPVLSIAAYYPVALVSLPVLAFIRCYALHFVAQFSPRFAVNWSSPARSHGFQVLPNP